MKSPLYTGKWQSFPKVQRLGAKSILWVSILHQRNCLALSYPPCLVTRGELARYFFFFFLLFFISLVGAAPTFFVTATWYESTNHNP